MAQKQSLQVAASSFMSECLYKRGKTLAANIDFAK